MIIDPATLKAMIERDINDPETWRSFFDGETNAFRSAYIEFLFKMTVCMVDTDKVHGKLLRGKPIHKIVTASDEAQAVFNYINNHEKWMKRHQERDNPTHSIHKDRKGGIYATSKGRGRFKSGYTEEGTLFYDKAVEFFKKARTMKYMEEYEMWCWDWYRSSALKARIEAGGTKKKAGATQINATVEAMPALPIPDDVLASMAAHDDDDESDYDDEEENQFNESHYNCGDEGDTTGSEATDDV